MNSDIPAALVQIAGKRSHITTAEFGALINKATQTIRKVYCNTGDAYGVRPIKVGRELNWPVAEIAALLQPK